SSKEIPFFSGKIDIGKTDRKQIVCLINILIDKLSVVLVDSELYLRFQFIHILKRLKNRHCGAVQLFREISGIQTFNPFFMNDLKCLLQNQFLCNSLFRRHENSSILFNIVRYITLVIIIVLSLFVNYFL